MPGKRWHDGILRRPLDGEASLSQLAAAYDISTAILEDLTGSQTA